jgi:hypothetical protein
MSPAPKRRARKPLAGRPDGALIVTSYERLEGYMG